jgi:hypothetical protein
VESPWSQQQQQLRLLQGPAGDTQSLIDTTALNKMHQHNMLLMLFIA